MKLKLKKKGYYARKTKERKKKNKRKRKRKRKSKKYGFFYSKSGDEIHISEKHFLWEKKISVIEWLNTHVFRVVINFGLDGGTKKNHGVYYYFERRKKSAGGGVWVEVLPEENGSVFQRYIRERIFKDNIVKQRNGVYYFKCLKDSNYLKVTSVGTCDYFFWCI